MHEMSLCRFVGGPLDGAAFEMPESVSFLVCRGGLSTPSDEIAIGGAVTRYQQRITPAGRVFRAIREPSPRRRA